MNRMPYVLGDEYLQSQGLDFDTAEFLGIDQVTATDVDKAILGLPKNTYLLFRQMSDSPEFTSSYINNTGGLEIVVEPSER